MKQDFSDRVTHISLAQAQAAVLNWDHVKVSCLNLSTRSSNCLRLADIRTMGELIKFNIADLNALPNFGRLCMLEIEAGMKKLGFSPKPPRLLEWVQRNTPSEEDTLDIKLHHMMPILGGTAENQPLVLRTPKVNQATIFKENGVYYISKFQGVIKIAVEEDELANLRDQIVQTLERK